MQIKEQTKRIPAIYLISIIKSQQLFKSMSFYHYIVFLIIFSACKNQKTAKPNEVVFVYQKQFLQNTNRTILEQYLEKFVDSINQASSETELPYFLNDSQFDFKNKGIWPSFHTPISVRSQIINRVNNCNSLRLIVNSKNMNYKNRPHEEDSLSPPSITLSYHDLVLSRLQSLNCD